MPQGNRKLSSYALLAALLFVVACAPTGRESAGTGAGSQPVTRRTESAAAQKTLVIANRSEPDSLSEKPLARVSGGGEREVPRLFSAALTLEDDRGQPRPYLAEALPELNTDSWRILSDGRMETTWRLKPNLTWHDGAPLTADDFVFAQRVYATPEFGLAGSPPVNQIADVLAPDDRTIVIRWLRPYPDATILGGMELAPLPRHRLEEDFQNQPAIAFASLPFWTTDYVGAGPFRVDRWESGSFLEGVAFPGHVGRKAGIERINVRFMPDSNAVMASLLSGDVHVAVRSSIEVPQGVVLRRDWSARNAGTVMMIPSFWRRAEVQQRPEFANPAALHQDVRVRRALAHAIDRQALNEGVFEGESILADAMIPPFAPYFAETDRVIMKYPYDSRRSEQLMNEAGWTRGPDGILANASGRFSLEVKVNASIEGGTELSIIGDALRRAGFDVQEVAVPRAQQRDGQVRGGFPGLYLGGGGLGERDTLPNLVSSTIPRPENRWVGNNRSGWSNAEYDRLFDSFSNTLARPDRDRLAVQMARVYAEDLGSIPSLFYPAVVASAAGLRGPAMHAGTNTVVWNVHEWAWASGA